ncbi:ATP-dependent DNA helicase RecG [Candidatus Parcubacteria bacterium]|nr:ATP-dependent DNA helicase RecG [Candidatus Parcubacteria bacterium]
MNLIDPLTQHFRIVPVQAAALKRLGLHSIEDLLYHFPVRYGDTAEIINIESLKKGDTGVVFGRISGLKTSKAFKKKISMSEAWVEDDTGRVKIVWFHQAYMAKIYREGALVRVEGKISEKKSLSAGRPGEIYFSNPHIETVGKLPIAVGNSLFGDAGEAHSLYPVYPETRGLTSNWITHKVQTIFSSGVLDGIHDPIPENILKTYNLPSLKTALIWIHTPQKKEHAEMARKRFAFEEIFFIQLEKQKSRFEFKERNAFVIEKSIDDIENFIDRFPFQATSAQRRTIEEALFDFRRGHPMARLLEGDVGSGKTAVAAAIAYAITTSKPKNQTFGTLQTAYMVPTEILAQQHFESFIKYFRHLPINIGLITGSGARKFPSKVNPSGWTDISRAQLLRWVASGEISILIGTHALIQKSVKFKHLALAIIDEQHRFGTAQRQKFATKESVTPHLMSMTATPIPRTLSLTLYGDLDLSLLDEMPAGRKQIITEIVLPNKRDETYEKLRGELKNGRQMYVICPRINEPDPDKENVLLAKSVKEEAKRLKEKIFPEYRIGILHSKMTPAEKERVMIEFKDKKIDILVATSVVEVGVNVENASLIVIEGAERFGLSQLHQLRGRVLRGTHQPYCFVFPETTSAKTVERLKALKTAKNGFELAEFDLQQRGAGELYGRKQWGISDLAMEAIKNLRMVEAARTEATKIIEGDPTLSKHPDIKHHLETTSQRIHFE